MHLMYHLNEKGERVYTLKKIVDNQATKSAHPARFSPDDKYSRQRVTLKKRFGLLPTQQPSGSGSLSSIAEEPGTNNGNINTKYGVPGVSAGYNNGGVNKRKHDSAFKDGGEGGSPLKKLKPGSQQPSVTKEVKELKDISEDERLKLAKERFLARLGY